MALIKHNDRSRYIQCKGSHGNPGCGSTALYWAHDTAPDAKRSRNRTCDKGHDAPDSWVLIDKTPETERAKAGDEVPEHTRHSLTCPMRKDKGNEQSQPEPQPEATPSAPEPQPEASSSAPSAPAVPGIDPAQVEALRSLLGVLGIGGVDRKQVEEVAREVINDIVFPTRTVVIRDEVKREIEGDTHKALGDVTTALLAGEHVMMVGPAGTGKSTIAEQAAEALGLPSYSISLSPQTPASQIIGYMQAEGEYVRTLFREAYENGGVFHFDEVDNAHPSVLAVINAALANGQMAFPDGMVKRHADFRCVASANTYGRGANSQYVGRSKMDAATLDRFTVITIEIDEALETALCNATGASAATVDKVLTYVRRLRRNAESQGLQVVLSPRATVGMCRLIHAGLEWDQAVDARVRRGLDDSTWSKLSKA